MNRGLAVQPACDASFWRSLAGPLFSLTGVELKLGEALTS